MTREEQLRIMIKNDIKKYGSVTSDTKLSAERTGHKISNGKVIIDKKSRKMANKATRGK